MAQNKNEASAKADTSFTGASDGIRTATAPLCVRPLTACLMG